MFPVRIISTNTLKEPETKQDKEDGMDDKRMIGDYTVLNSMYVGHKEIAICENQKAAKDVYSLSTKRRVYNWHDIRVRLYI